MRFQSTGPTASNSRDQTQARLSVPILAGRGWVCGHADERESSAMSAHCEHCAPEYTSCWNDGDKCTKRPLGSPVCVRYDCRRTPLKYMKAGESHQTANGHFTISISGWYCPRCGAGYGGAGVFAYSVRDWPEDFEHENGQYYNECVMCQQTFIGHKRRHICRVCSTESAKKNP
jgi:hypothetical protein